MNSKWIKAEDLPEGFCDDCFVAWEYKGNIEVNEYLSFIKKDGEIVKCFLEHIQDWRELGTDANYLFMPIQYPSVSKEDFK